MLKRLLNRLAIPPTYLGHSYTLEAVSIVLQKEAALTALTKELYPEVAQKFGVSAHSVERALRTAVDQCWTNGGRELLEDIAGRRLKLKPTVGEFIAILADYMDNSS